MCTDVWTYLKFIISSISSVSSTPLRLYKAVKIIIHKHYIHHVSMLLQHIQWLFADKSNLIVSKLVWRSFIIIPDTCPCNNQKYSYELSFFSKNIIINDISYRFILNLFNEAHHSQGTSHDSETVVSYLEKALTLCIIKESFTVPKEGLYCFTRQVSKCDCIIHQTSKADRTISTQ